ncbi:MAG: hypothetical protein WDM91_08620 [Rhizomicrobium sp.]
MATTMSVRATADLLIQGFPDDAHAIALHLAEDNLNNGDPDRAAMWADVAETVEVLMEMGRGEDVPADA